MKTLPINNIIRSIDRVQQPDSKLNIMTICRNTEKYISLLAQTQHNFYILPTAIWNNSIEKRPPNVYSFTNLSPPMDYLICYDRAEQYDEMLLLAQQLQVPTIIVNMCSKQLIRPQHIVETMKDIDLDILQNRQATLYIYNDTHIEQSWESDTFQPSKVIHIGIDTDKFKSESSQNTAIALDNNTVPQVGAILAAHINNTYPIIPTDHDNTTITVNTTKYFINTRKNITIKTLEAMAAENVVICLSTPDTSSYITHQETGWLVNDLNELPNVLTLLEQSDELRMKIAKQARQKIITEHALDRFVSQWLEVLNMIRGAIYHPTGQPI